jgi:hypothetical protein
MIRLNNEERPLDRCKDWTPKNPADSEAGAALVRPVAG